MKRDLTQNEEMVFNYLLENGSNSNYKEVFFKGIITKTGLIRTEINIILGELESMGLISINKQKNPNNNFSKWYYKLSQPVQKSKEKKVLSMEEVVSEIENQEIIFAGADEDEYIARYKGYCKWAVREIYNADVIGLIECRIKNYRGGNINSDDIEYIIDEADVNARKNTINKVSGFIEKTFIAHLTKSTLERIMNNEFISNKPTIIDLIAETFDEYGITVTNKENTKSVA